MITCALAFLVLVPNQVPQTVTFEVYNRGKFQIKLDTDGAPLTSQHFITNVKAGIYNGMLWHRKVDGFVLQTGDPESKALLPHEAREKPGESGGTKGLGEATIGPTIDFENTKLSHLKGTVGVALESPGDNSGSSHIFINLADNKRLDGKYACFAQVVTGWEVVEKCQRGDLIVSAKVD